MKLLIVVDKLLTGFDAPPCTYLYIDKRMQDHGLFQAICRVNRLDDDTKDFGYIVDYKQLFGQLQTAMKDYTSGAFEGYDPEDVKDLSKIAMMLRYPILRKCMMLSRNSGRRRGTSWRDPVHTLFLWRFWTV